MINNTGILVYFIGIPFSLVFILLTDIYRIHDTNIDISGEERRRKKAVTSASFFLFMSFLCMWLISAVRNGVGADYETYFMKYQKIQGFSDIIEFYEPGYGLLNYLVQIVFNDFQWVLIITALLTGWLFWKSIYRDGGNLVLCVLGIIAANLYFMSFTVIRQFLAIAVLSMSIPHIKQRNFKKFLIYYLLAISFHYTAAVFIVLYFFAGQKNEKIFTFKNLLFVLTVLIFIANMDRIIPEVFKAMSNIKDNYIEYSEYDGKEKNLIEVVVLLPVMIFGLAARKKLIEINPNNDVYIWMSVFLILTKLIGIYYVNFSRIHYYFVFSMPVLLSYAPKISSKEFKPIVYIIVSVYFAYLIRNIYYYQSLDFLPYYSIFD